jgi:hypothetical protein
MANCLATQRLKPSNFCMNGNHPLSSRSLRALSNINRAWLPFGSALTTGAMVRAHGKGLGHIHQHTGEKSFGLTTTNDQRGSINVRMGGWWNYSLPCIIVMEKYNRQLILCSINHNHSSKPYHSFNQRIKWWMIYQCAIIIFQTMNIQCEIKPKC